MKTLRATDHSRQRLNRNSRNVVQRLLCGETNTGHLSVKAEHGGFWVFWVVTFNHQVVPECACGPEFCNLFKEVIVAVEKERQPWGKCIHIKSLRNGCIHIGQCVGERERHFLNRR